MIAELKKLFYFPIAYYFRFFAQIRLSLWKPRIIVVTGSSGKTTLLHLIESQLGNKAKYSFKANSSYGIPFNILGLERKTLSKTEWPALFLKAPFKTFEKIPKEKLYVVEADCDRPFEGKFLSEFLKPEATLWLSISKTHSMNFENLVREGTFANVEAAIAYEFGYFLKNTSKLIIVNGDSELIEKQLNRTSAKKIKIRKTNLNNYRLFEKHTEFTINKKSYSINAILPEDLFYSIEMVNTLINYLNLKIDTAFSKFQLPPGRNSIFEGIKKITILDSSYNNSLYGAKIMIDVLINYPLKPKWLVLGDILEQGIYEREEHEKLSDIIISSGDKLDKIILIGPRLVKHTYSKLKSLDQSKIKTFLMPKDALDYLKKEIKGEELILFKGARFLEGIIEHLLKNKDDIAKLARRELVWQKRRKQWEL